jgi:hypothetical protein
MEGRQVVLLLDLNHLLHRAAPLGQQLHQLFIDAVDLLAQLPKPGMVGSSGCRPGTSRG